MLSWQSGSEAFIGCNYFKWCSEDAGDERDNTIKGNEEDIYYGERT